MSLEKRFDWPSQRRDVFAFTLPGGWLGYEPASGWELGETGVSPLALAHRLGRHLARSRYSVLWSASHYSEVSLGLVTQSCRADAIMLGPRVSLVTQCWLHYCSSCLYPGSCSLYFGSRSLDSGAVQFIPYFSV